MAIQVHTLFTGAVNTFIIQSCGLVVIDTGMPHRAKWIADKIRSVGYSPSDVGLIIVTHGHIDHAGSAVALKRLTGAPIAIHRADARLVATPGLQVPPGRNAAINAIRWLMERFGWAMPLETFTPEVWLEDGQSLRDFGIDARVVHTPGHTAGSISILLDDGTLFVGDAILNLVRVSFPLFWENPAAAWESALKIQSLKPRVCYTAHGRAFDPNRLDAFIARWKAHQETEKRT